MYKYASNAIDILLVYITMTRSDLIAENLNIEEQQEQKKEEEIRIDAFAFFFCIFIKRTLVILDTLVV